MKENSKIYEIILKTQKAVEDFFVFSRRHATLHLAVSVDRQSLTFLNSKRFSQYCSCPTVCDWIAVYPALFYDHEFLFGRVLFDCRRLFGTVITNNFIHLILPCL